MTTQTTSRRSSIRAFVVAIGLLLASVFATSSVSASTLIPFVDAGGSGGGGIASTYDVPVAQSPNQVTF